MGNAMPSRNGKHHNQPKTSGSKGDTNCKSSNSSIDKSIFKHHMIGANRNNFNCSSPLHFPRSESQIRVCSDINSINDEELELKQDAIFMFKDENTKNHDIIDQLVQFGFGKNEITATMNELSGSGSLSLDINGVLESMEEKQTLKQYHTLSKFIDNTMPNV